MLLCMLEVMRRVLLCMLEAVEGELCSLELMRCMLLCVLDAVGVGSLSRFRNFLGRLGQTIHLPEVCIITPQERFTVKTLPNLEGGPAAFGGPFPSMPRTTSQSWTKGFY